MGFKKRYFELAEYLHGYLEGHKIQELELAKYKVVVDMLQNDLKKKEAEIKSLHKSSEIIGGIYEDVRRISRSMSFHNTSPNVEEVANLRGKNQELAVQIKELTLLLDKELSKYRFENHTSMY